MDLPRDEWALLVLLAGIPAVLFIDYCRHRKTAPEKSRRPDLAGDDAAPYPFRERLLVTLVMAFWLYGLIGPLFVPSEAFRDTGTGMALAGDVWATAWAVKRYRSGKWRDTPGMTAGKAKFGFACVPLVMFFIFWGAVVVTGGGLFTRFTGTPDTLRLAVKKYHYRDKFGDHYCLAAPEFRPAYPLDFFDKFCGIDEEAFGALPDKFTGVFTLRRSALGFIVEDYKRD